MNYRQPIQNNARKNSFLAPINTNQNVGAGVDTSDPNFLAKLTQKLGKNEEIRVKRIYHINKPLAEPAEEVKVEQTTKKHVEEDESSYDDASEDDISNDSRLSYISNPASVVRKNTKMKHMLPLRRPHHHDYMPQPHYCPICDMESRHRSYENINYHNMHMHDYHRSHNPYNRAPSCQICNSQHPLPLTYPVQPYQYHNSVPQTPTNMHSYFSNKPMLMANRENTQMNNQHFLPPISQNNRVNAIPMQNPYNTFPQQNGYIQENGYSSNYAPNNKRSMSYKDLFQNRNRLIDYTYDKYNPQNNKRQGSGESRVVNLYKD